MLKSNYHSHCSYCDGKFEPEAHLLSAIEKGLHSYGFSSHAPLPFPNKWSMKKEHLAHYLKEILRLKDDYESEIKVYCGLEVDYIPGVTGPGNPEFSRPPFHYLIGSIHFIDSFADGTPWEIDGSHEVFLQGLKYIFDGDIKAVIEKYFLLTRKMVQEETPDIVGHLDKIKIQNISNLYSEEASWYQQEIMHTLEEIAATGSIIEVNTRGLYKKKSLDLYPGIWVLQQIKNMKIPIVLNSDSHHPEEIEKLFNDTAEKLKSIGFKTVKIFNDHQWEDTSL
ncbi:histidinol-phosphatase [soil metagenome]